MTGNVDRPGQFFNDDITVPPAERGERLAHGIRRPLDREERDIKDMLLRTSSLVGVAIANTVEAFETHDAAKARGVIEGDAAINALTATAIEEVITTIATQAPVARDLRFLLTLYDVAVELERIGDSVANVEVPAMGRLAIELLADVMRALVDSDVELARTTAHRDDEMDLMYHRAMAQLAALSKLDPGNVDRANLLQLAAHYLERVGDRVTNIAEDVVFLSTGLREDLN